MTALFGLVSCNYLQDIFEVAIMKTLLGPDQGPNYLKGLSADDNNMLRFNFNLS